MRYLVDADVDGLFSNPGQERWIDVMRVLLVQLSWGKALDTIPDHA